LASFLSRNSSTDFTDEATKDVDKALMDKQDEDEDECAGQHKNPQDDDIAAPESAKDAKPASGNNAASAATGDVPTTAALPAAKRAGRPLGAPGFGRTQKLIPTKFVHKHPEVCTGCLHPFTANDPAQAWTAWDTLELRALSEDDTHTHQLGVYLEVTRHFLMQRQCTCGHLTQAQAQRADDDKAQWAGVRIGEQRLLGPRLAATVVYLSLRMRLPRLKVQELLLELFGLELSTALIDQTIKQTARSVEPLQPELVRQLQVAVLAHADETSWPERTLRLWLWVFCCSHTVLYVIGARTKEMFECALGSSFAGTLMSDGYQAYRSTANRLRCWAHLMRKLRGVAESTDTQAAANGRTMLDLFGSLMQGVFEARDKAKALPTGVQDDPPTHPVVPHAKQVGELKALCEKHRDARHEALRAIAREFLYDWEAIMRVFPSSTVKSVSR